MAKVNRLLLTVLAMAVVAGLAGCVGTGSGNQFQNTVYDTYRRVANLDKNLQSSVTQLNETTATLLTRVEESDKQLQSVQGVLEQNQAKLASLEKKLDSLTNIIYREQGRTLLPGTPSSVVPPAGPVTEVGVGAAPATAPGAVVPPAAPAPAVAQPPDQPPLEPIAVGPQPTAPPAATPPSTGSAEGDYLAAQKNYARQDYQGALDQFGAFLQKYPLSSQAQNAQFWRAKSFQALERYEEAIAEYNRLRDAYPAAGDNAASSKVPQAMHQQAVCHARLGQSERAIELFKQVIRDFPNSPAAVQATQDLQHIQ
jgi:tol-pal system protein YbgF